MNDLDGVEPNNKDNLVKRKDEQHSPDLQSDLRKQEQTTSPKNEIDKGPNKSNESISNDEEKDTDEKSDSEAKDDSNSSDEPTDEFGRPLTAYEIMRLEKIKRNNAFLAKLGLEEAKAQQEEEMRKKKAAAKRDKKGPVFYEQRETLSRRTKGKNVSYAMPKISEFRETLASAKKKNKRKREKSASREDRVPREIYNELKSIQANKRQRLVTAERLVRMSEKEVRLSERFAEKQERREQAKKEREERKKLAESKRALLPIVQELDKRRNEILRNRKRLADLAQVGVSQEKRKQMIQDFISKAEEDFPQELKDIEQSLGQMFLERIPPFQLEEISLHSKKSSKKGSRVDTKVATKTAAGSVIEENEEQSQTALSVSDIQVPMNLDLEECEKTANDIVAKRKERSELKSRNVGGPVTESLAAAVQRGWCDNDHPISAGCYLDYVPQVGDVVLYYPCAHYDFLKEHPDIRCKKKRLKLRRPLWEVALEEKKQQEANYKESKRANSDANKTKRKARDSRPWWTDQWMASISSDTGGYPILCRVDKVIAEFPYDQESETEQRRFQNEVYKANLGKKITGKRRGDKGRKKPLRHKPPMALAVNLKPLAPIAPPTRTRRNVLKGDLDDVNLSLPPLFSVLTHPSDEKDPFVIPFLPAYRASLATKLESSAKLTTCNGSRRSVKILAVDEDKQEPFDSISKLFAEIINRHCNIDFSSIHKLDNIITCCYGPSGSDLFPEGELRAAIQTILYQIQTMNTFEGERLFQNNDISSNPKEIDNRGDEFLVKDLFDLIRLTIPRWNAIHLISEDDSSEERMACCWQLSFADDDGDFSHNDAVSAALSPTILFSSTRISAGSLVYSFDEALRKEIVSVLEYIIETHPKAYLFCPPVTEAVAPEYFRFVPYGMCLRKILKRLQPHKMRYPRQASKSAEDSLEDQGYGESYFCYYRHVSSITSDIMDIFANCLLYNAPESEIVSDALSVSMYLKVVIEKLAENRQNSIFKAASDARNVDLVLNSDEGMQSMTRKMRLQSAVKPFEVEEYDAFCESHLSRSWMNLIEADNSWSSNKNSHQWLPQYGDKVIYNRVLHAQFVQGHSRSLKINQRSLPPLLPPKRRKKNESKQEVDNANDDSEKYQYFLGTVQWVRSVMPNDEAPVSDKRLLDSPILAIGISFHYKWLQDMTHVIYWRPCEISPGSGISGHCEECGLSNDQSFLCPAWSGPLDKILPPYPLSYGRFERPSGIPCARIERVHNCLNVLRERIVNQQELGAFEPNMSLLQIDSLEVMDIPSKFRYIFKDKKAEVGAPKDNLSTTNSENSDALQILSEFFFQMPWEQNNSFSNDTSLSFHESIMANAHLCLSVIVERLVAGYYRSLPAVVHDIREACASIIRFIVKERIRNNLIDDSSERKVLRALIELLEVDILDADKNNDLNEDGTLTPSKPATPKLNLSDLSSQERNVILFMKDVIRLYALAQLCCEDTSIAEVALGLEAEDFKFQHTVLSDQQEIAIKNSGQMMAALGKDQMKFRKPLANGLVPPSVNVFLKASFLGNTGMQVNDSHGTSSSSADIFFGPPIILHPQDYKKNKRLMALVNQTSKQRSALPDIKVVVRTELHQDRAAEEFFGPPIILYPEAINRNSKLLRIMKPFQKDRKVVSNLKVLVKGTCTAYSPPKIIFSSQEYRTNKKLKKVFAQVKGNKNHDISVVVRFKGDNYTDIQRPQQEPHADDAIMELKRNACSDVEKESISHDNEENSFISDELLRPLVFEYDDYKANPALASALFCQPNRKDVCARCTLKKQDIISCRIREGHSNRDFIWTEYLREIGGVDGLILRLHPKWRPPPIITGFSPNMHRDDIGNEVEIEDGQLSQSQNALEATLTIKTKCPPPAELRSKSKKALNIANQLLQRAKDDAEKPAMLGADFLNSHYNVDPEDGHFEICIMCGLGGDVICCETCPMVSHPKCVNMESIPDEDWHCYLCKEKQSILDDTEKNVTNDHTLNTDDDVIVAEGMVTSLVEELKSYRQRGPTVALGSKIAKLIDGVYYEGEVTGLPLSEDDDNIYKVQFDDDDEEEEVTAEELQNYLSHYNAMQQEEATKNESEDEEYEEDIVIKKRGRPRKIVQEEENNLNSISSERRRSRSRPQSQRHRGRPKKSGNGRGRPRKNVEVDSYSSEEEEPPTKRPRHTNTKKRGRPTRHRDDSSLEDSSPQKTRKTRGRPPKLSRRTLMDSSGPEEEVYTQTGRRLRTPDRFAPTSTESSNPRRRGASVDTKSLETKGRRSKKVNQGRLKKNTKENTRAKSNDFEPDCPPEHLPLPGRVDPNLTYYCTVENDTSATIARKLGCDSWLDIAYVPENMNRFPALQNKGIKFRKGTLIRFAECKFDKNKAKKLMNNKVVYDVQRG